MKDFNVYGIGLVYASVCSSLSLEDTTKLLNQEHPTGIDSQWSLSGDKTFKDGKTLNPSACLDHPKTHKHYLFSC